MKNLIKFSLVLSFIFCQTSPVDIATSGANKLRMHGQLNVFHNPATLGYKAAQLDSEATVNNLPLEESGELVNAFQDISTTDSDSLDNEFSEFESADEGGPDSLSIKIEDIIASADSLLADSLISESNFSMSLFNVSFGLGSGSITPNWISNQLFGGKDLRNAQERKDFLKGISNDINIQVPVFSSLPLINFSFGSNVVSLGQVVSYTSVNIPSGLAQVPFIGLEKGKELNISSLEMEHITYLPISYSKGFILKPGIIPFGQKSYAGLRSNLLIGLAEVHTASVNGKIQGTDANTLIDADIELGASLPVSIDDSIPKGSFPIGIGFDLGIITEIDEKLTIGASIDNIFASFKWSGATVYTASVLGELTPEDIAEADSITNLLNQSEVKESSSYKTSLPTSINISGTYKAVEWVTLDANIRIDFGKSYWASSTPLISLGSEFYPNSKSPIYFGLLFGGENSFGWGTGMSLKMGSVIFDISGGQLGGIFNNATGMQLGFGLRIQK